MSVFFRYETAEDGSWHQWAAIDREAKRAVHVWCRREAALDGRWYGGVEQHVTPEPGQTPSHELCSFLGGPCCHDGSSLYFEDWYKTRVIDVLATNDHARMFRMVHGELRRRFQEQEA